MKNDETKLVRDQLAVAVGGGESHIDFASVVRNFPPPLRGAKPDGAPHTPWQLLEHMRIAQWDILEFSRNPDHKSPHFPDGYWPPTAMPPDDQAWDRTAEAFEKDAKDFENLIRDADLFKPFSHGDGQTLLREAVVLANHNSYHLGQLAFLKKMLSGKAN